MTDKKIRLKIVTPERVVFENDVDAVYASGTSGSFGVLPDHIPFMTTLKTDVAKAIIGNEIKMFSVMGGTFQFQKNEAVILSEAAECGSEIDKSRAQLAKERAEAEFGSATAEKDKKFAEAARTRAMVRLKASAMQK